MTALPDDLSCQELVALVTEYLEDALPPAERVRFEAHLTGCLGCRRYFAQMRTTIRALGRLTEESLEPVARDELLRLFRSWKLGDERG